MCQENRVDDCDRSFCYDSLTQSYDIRIAERRTAPQEKAERVIDSCRSSTTRTQNDPSKDCCSGSQCRKLLALAIEVAVTQRVTTHIKNAQETQDRQSV